MALRRAGDRRGGLPQPARGRRSTSSARCTLGSAAATSHGEPLLVEASGLEARVLQHEIDHLDGVLILDRTEREQRKGALRALREGEQLQPADDRRRAQARRRTAAPSDSLRVVYLGTSEFAVAVLRRLADSPHRPALVGHAARPPAGPGPQARRRRRRRRPPASSGIELLQTAERRATRGAWTRIRAAAPEVGVVCAFGQLIREPLLSELEMLNVHPSLLPRWRGAAPIERAIMAGDARDRGHDHAGDGGARLRPGRASGADADRARATTSARSRPASPSSAASCSSGRSTCARPASSSSPSRTSRWRPTPRRSPRPSAASTPPARRSSWSARCGRSTRTSAPTWSSTAASGSACAPPRAERRRAGARPARGRGRGAAARLRARACCASSVVQPAGRRPMDGRRLPARPPAAAAGAS